MKNRVMSDVRATIMQESMEIPVTPRQTMQFVLVCDNAITPKIRLAQRLLIEVIVSRGFSEKDLAECAGHIRARQSLNDQIERYLNRFRCKIQKAGTFVDLAYSRGWVDDAAVLGWFEKVSNSELPTSRGVK